MPFHACGFNEMQVVFLTEQIEGILGIDGALEHSSMQLMQCIEDTLEN